MRGEMARPIGMFDSGFGGLTVARAVIDLLPAENLVYIGDTGRYPYGPRPQDEVRQFARELAWSLVKQHEAKAVVVACNTASAAALDMDYLTWGRHFRCFPGQGEMPIADFTAALGSTGWDGVLRRYKKSYPDHAAMGQLEFSDLEFRFLGPDAALVLGQWHLKRESGDIGGVFTLVWQKFPDGWKIIHDHTSAVGAKP